MKVAATFSRQLMSNNTTKMTKDFIEINDFSQIWHGETFQEFK